MMRQLQTGPPAQVCCLSLYWPSRSNCVSNTTLWEIKAPTGWTRQVCHSALQCSESNGYKKLTKQPEWAFASLLDTLYQQSPFLTSTISTLTRCSDPLFREIDVRAEFTLSLLSTALSLLRLRIPKILDKPSLLAHTIYQTIVFDDAIRQGGFDLARTTYGRRLAERAVQREGADGQSGAGDKQIDEGQGLTGVVLRESGWYEHWVKGEKQCGLSISMKQARAPVGPIRSKAKQVSRRYANARHYRFVRRLDDH